jgi:hypothetical protein
MIKKIFVLFLLIFTITPAQEYHIDSLSAGSDNFLNKKVLSVAGVSGIYVGSIVDSYIIWWKDDKRPFTFKSGSWFSNSDNGIDKLGHFYTSYAFYKIQKNIFLWGGYTPETSRMLSGSLTLLMALIIEFGDGFSRYGFDYKDFSFNAAGLAYGILQDEVSFLRNINFKWSYYPSTGFAFPPKFSDHYEGHIYWLTLNVNGILGDFWPEYIQPAVGYSISKDLQREYILGLDLNLLPLFRSESPLTEYIGEIINLFHLPSPGVKYSEFNTPEYKLFLLN